jgi:hypothetical protein
MRSTLIDMGRLLRRLRYAGPLALAFALMIASQYVGTILTWILVLAAFALVIEVATAWLEAAGSTGGARHHRQ